MSPSKKTVHVPLVMAVLSAIPHVQPAWAGVGVQVGARGGLEFRQDDNPAVGGELRLSFPRSPLTINPAFDYYFIEDETLYQISANALYDLPISIPLMKLYVGPGVGLSLFSREEAPPGTPGPAGSDGHGSRLGLNLVGGVRFDLPVLRPFVQGMVSIGEIDLVTVGGGILFDIGGG